MSCIEISYLGFNTTFVTVLFLTMALITVTSSVSIQLLLLFYVYLITCSKNYACFNTTFVTVLYKYYVWQFKGNSGFQYNFCYCSIVHRSTDYLGQTGFNTTFVTVLYSPALLLSNVTVCFNTTFVTVLWDYS